MNIHILISCLVLLETGTGLRPHDGVGCLSIHRAALRDYNRHAACRVEMDDLQDPECSVEVARVLIEDVWRVKGAERIGSRWVSGKARSWAGRDYGRRLRNLYAERAGG